MRRAAPMPVVLLLLAAIAACGSSDHPMTRAQARAATRRGSADAAFLLRRDWKPATTPSTADTIIASRCGNTRPGLGAPTAGLLVSETSPTLTRDPNFGASPKEAANARTAVLAYRDADQAQAAMQHLGIDALNDCLIAAARSYLTTSRSDTDPVPDPTDSSFLTVASGDPRAGDPRIEIFSMFDENVLGGFDNSHNVDVVGIRSGSLVVTAIATTSRETPNADHAAALARRLATSALTAAKSDFRK